MLYTIAVVLLVLWLLGLVTSYTMGGFIHVLLVVAVVMVLVNLISGRKRADLRSCQPKKANWRFDMNTKTIVAVILVALGIVVLAYSGITFKTPGKPVEFLGLHIETTDSHFIPPVVGALALVGGIVLLVVNPKRV